MKHAIEAVTSTTPATSMCSALSDIVAGLGRTCRGVWKESVIIVVARKASGTLILQSVSMSLARQANPTRSPISTTLGRQRHRLEAVQ